MDHPDHQPLLRPRDRPLLCLQPDGKQYEVDMCITMTFSDPSLAANHKWRSTRGRGDRDGHEGEGGQASGEQGARFQMGCPSGMMRTIVLDQDVDHLVLTNKQTNKT